MTDLWTEEHVAFMHDAMEKSDYYARIAAHILPHLAPTAQLCDAGCGMGGLSLALAAHCAHVTAVDRSDLAVDYLRKRAGKNITALCADMAALSSAEPFDAMVFCLFGRMEETIAIAARHCSGEVFLIKRDYDRHRFSAGEMKLGEFTAQHARSFLKERGIPFAAEYFAADFPQPFRDLSAAERFFALYNRSKTAQFTREEIAAKLLRTEDETFPYILPNEKSLCLLRFAARDIPARG